MIPRNWTPSLGRSVATFLFQLFDPRHHCCTIALPIHHLSEWMHEWRNCFTFPWFQGWNVIIKSILPSQRLASSKLLLERCSMTKRPKSNWQFESIWHVFWKNLETGFSRKHFGLKSPCLSCYVMFRPHNLVKGSVDLFIECFIEPLHLQFVCNDPMKRNSKDISEI